MDARQFETIAKLIRSRGASKEAARLVIVEGFARKDAAARTGIAGPAVTGAVKRFRKAESLISEGYAAGITEQDYKKAIHLVIGCMVRSSRLANFRFLHEGKEKGRVADNRAMAQVINRELNLANLPGVSEEFSAGQVAEAVSLSGLR